MQSLLKITAYRIKKKKKNCPVNDCHDRNSTRWRDLTSLGICYLLCRIYEESNNNNKERNTSLIHWTVLLQMVPKEGKFVQFDTIFYAYLPPYHSATGGMSKVYVVEVANECLRILV